MSRTEYIYLCGCMSLYAEELEDEKEELGDV